MKAALDFWVRAHQDERNEPSGPRLGGFILVVFILLLASVAMYAAFAGQKLAAETGVKLVVGLGTVAGVLYGASQVKGGLSGLAGLFVTKPVDGMPGQAPLQQTALPQMAVTSDSLQSLHLSTKAPQKPNASTVERWRDRIARIIRAQDLVGTLVPQRESLQRIRKPLTKDLEEKLALAVETKPWEPSREVTWRPQ